MLVLKSYSQSIIDIRHNQNLCN